MKKIWVIPFLIAILVTGCAAPTATVAPTAPTLDPTTTAGSYPAPAATQVAPSSAYPPASSTELPASQPPAAGQTTFNLIPDQTSVSYSVEETFINDNNRLATAVGLTNQVTGQLKVDLSNPVQTASGEFQVDISTLTSDSSRRDNAIRGRWLESSRFPTALFKISSLQNFPANPAEGQALRFQMVGDLTVREATRPVTWDVSATLNGKTLSGEATTFIMMADWGVEPPNIANILRVKDGVTLTLKFTFQTN